MATNGLLHKSRPIIVPEKLLVLPSLGTNNRGVSVIFVRSYLIVFVLQLACGCPPRTAPICLGPLAFHRVRLILIAHHRRLAGSGLSARPRPLQVLRVLRRPLVIHLEEWKLCYSCVVWSPVVAHLLLFLV